MKGGRFVSGRHAGINSASVIRSGSPGRVSAAGNVSEVHVAASVICYLVGKRFETGRWALKMLRPEAKESAGLTFETAESGLD